MVAHKKVTVTLPKLICNIVYHSKIISSQLASELQSSTVCGSDLMQKLRDILRRCRFYWSAAVLAFEDPNYKIIYILVKLNS